MLEPFWSWTELALTNVTDTSEACKGRTPPCPGWISSLDELDISSSKAADRLFRALVPLPPRAGLWAIKVPWLEILMSLSTQEISMQSDTARSFCCSQLFYHHSWNWFSFCFPPKLFRRYEDKNEKMDSGMIGALCRTAVWFDKVFVMCRNVSFFLFLSQDLMSSSVVSLKYRVVESKECKNCCLL